MPSDTTAAGHPNLPLRSLRLLQLLNGGQPIAEIANRLSLTPGSANEYIKRMYRLFDVHSRDELVAFARRAGLVEEPARERQRPAWLTPLRLRHLALAQRGLSYQQIAERLGKTRWSVDKLFQYVRAVLHVASTDEAIEAVVALGFLKERERAWVPNPIAPAEHELLDLLALGYTTREVADALNLTYGGVLARVGRLCSKIRVRDVPALLAAVERLGVHHFRRRRKNVPEAQLLAIAEHTKLKSPTKREQEVLALLLQSPKLSNADLAEILGIAKSTVLSHMFKLLHFYAVETRQDLVAVAKMQQLPAKPEPLKAYRPHPSSRRRGPRLSK